MPSAVRRRSAATSATGRPSTSAGAVPTTAARSRTWAAVAANHIRALGVCSLSSQPSREQEVDRPVGVAQPQEHPQALGHRALHLGSSCARCRARRGTPRPHPRRHRGRGAGRRRPRGWTGGSSLRIELSLDDRLEQFEGPPGVLGGHDARLVAVPARRAVAAAVAWLGAPGGELTGRTLGSPWRCASRARAACTGRRW